MLRHNSLHLLSHQHQHALALCVTVQRELAGAAPAVAALASRVRNEFEQELAIHFELEEQILFPAIEEELGPMELAGRLIEEHRRLEALAEGLNTARQEEALKEFIGLLRRHVRTEENELFEQVQTLLRPATLKAIGVEMERRVIRARSFERNHSD